MASTPPNNFNFPFFPPPFPPFHPPPPPSHSFTPPPPPPPRGQPRPPPHSFSPPLPPPHARPPPPPPPHVRPPPPPSHPIVPPPPHVRPPPAPLPPSPTPDNHPIVIVVVFVSLGGLLLLSLLAFALFRFIKRRKKRTCRETDIIHIDEHKKVKEAIVPGPFGQQTVMLSVEDDVHIDEEIKKGRGLHAKSSSADDQVSSTIHDVGKTSGYEEHHHELQHKPTSHD